MSTGARHAFQRRTRRERKGALLALFPSASCIVDVDGGRLIITESRPIGRGGTARQAWWDAWCREIGGSVDQARAAVKTRFPHARAVYVGGGVWSVRSVSMAEPVMGTTPFRAWLAAAKHLSTPRR